MRFSTSLCVRQWRAGCTCMCAWPRDERIGGMRLANWMAPRLIGSTRAMHLTSDRLSVAHAQQSLFLLDETHVDRKG